MLKFRHDLFLGSKKTDTTLLNALKPEAMCAVLTSFAQLPNNAAFRATQEHLVTNYILRPEDVSETRDGRERYYTSSSSGTSSFSSSETGSVHRTGMDLFGGGSDSTLASDGGLDAFLARIIEGGSSSAGELAKSRSAGVDEVFGRGEDGNKPLPFVEKHVQKARDTETIARTAWAISKLVKTLNLSSSSSLPHVGLDRTGNNFSPTAKQQVIRLFRETIDHTHRRFTGRHAVGRADLMKGQWLTTLVWSLAHSGVLEAVLASEKGSPLRREIVENEMSGENVFGTAGGTREDASDIRARLSQLYAAALEQVDGKLERAFGRMPKQSIGRTPSAADSLFVDDEKDPFPAKTKNPLLRSRKGSAVSPALLHGPRWVANLTWAFADPLVDGHLDKIIADWTLHPEIVKRYKPVELTGVLWALARAGQYADLERGMTALREKVEGAPSAGSCCFRGRLQAGSSDAGGVSAGHGKASPLFARHRYSGGDVANLAWIVGRLPIRSSVNEWYVGWVLGRILDVIVSASSSSSSGKNLLQTQQQQTTRFSTYDQVKILYAFGALQANGYNPHQLKALENYKKMPANIDVLLQQGSSKEKSSTAGSTLTGSLIATQPRDAFDRILKGVFDLFARDLIQTFSTASLTTSSASDLTGAVDGAGADSLEVSSSSSSSENKSSLSSVGAIQVLWAYSRFDFGLRADNLFRLLGARSHPQSLAECSMLTAALSKVGWAEQVFL